MQSRRVYPKTDKMQEQFTWMYSAQVSVETFVCRSLMVSLSASGINDLEVLGRE